MDFSFATFCTFVGWLAGGSAGAAIGCVLAFLIACIE
ncbi:MAG: hypothetical protein RIS97_812 [Pseudomonadota bacterium]|jgi:hypothetical protein